MCQIVTIADLYIATVYLSGAVFIDRKNRHDAVKAFNQVSQRMKEQKVRDIHISRNPHFPSHPAC